MNSNRILTVDGIGEKSEHYRTIAEALANAESGDTISVVAAIVERNAFTVAAGVTIRFELSASGSICSGECAVNGKFETNADVVFAKLALNGDAVLNGILKTEQTLFLNGTSLTVGGNGGLAGTEAEVTGTTSVSGDLTGDGRMTLSVDGSSEFTVSGTVQGFTDVDLKHGTGSVEFSALTVVGEGVARSLSVGAGRTLNAGSVRVDGQTLLGGTLALRGETLLHEIVFHEGGVLDLTAADAKAESDFVRADGACTILGFLGLSDTNATLFWTEDTADMYVSEEQFLEFSAADGITANGGIVVTDSTSELNWKTLQQLSDSKVMRKFRTYGTIAGANKISFKSNANLQMISVGGLLGTAKNDSITLGSDCNIVLGKVDLLAGKNSVTVGANARLRMELDLLNAGKLTVKAGKTYKNVNGQKAQGWSSLWVEGNVCGAAAADSVLTIGKFALVRIAGGYTTGDINFTASASIGSGSVVELYGAMDRISKLTLSDSTVCLNTAGEKINAATSLTLFADPADSSKSILSGTAGNDTYTFGRNTRFSAGGVAMLGGNNVIQLKAGSSFYTEGGVSGVTTLKTENGKSEITVKGDWYGDSRNGTMTIGSDSIFRADGTFDLREGKNTMKVGSNASVTLGAMKNISVLTLSDGKTAKGASAQTRTILNASALAMTNSASLTVGNQASLVLTGGFDTSEAATVKVGSNAVLRIGGDAGHIKSLTAAGDKKGACIVTIAGTLTGTAGSDTLKFGIGTQFHVAGNLDLGVDGSNSLELGDRSVLRLDGALSGMNHVKLGKSCTAELSTESVSALFAVKNHVMGAGTVLYDIGRIGTAEYFTDSRTEILDNTLNSSSILREDACGWLSNGQSTLGDKVSTYTDFADFFRAEDSYGFVADSLEGWRITGSQTLLEAAVYTRSASTGEWTEHCLIWDEGWDLGSVDLSGSSDYRIAMSISEGVMTSSIVSYRLVHLA